MKTISLQRVAAVDVFRALTMFLMLFVNDIPGLRGVPVWLLHAQATEDRMGFSDIIFPAFLFCMGMSVSFALQNRYRRGESTLEVLAHVFWRSLALVAMGLFSMNSGGVPGGLSHAGFLLLMVVGFFLTWGVYPAGGGARRWLYGGMKALGVAVLAALVVYKDVCGMPFRVGWWGILGLIGWTYAVCALIYLFTRESLRRNLVVWAVLLGLSVLSHAELIPEGYGSRVILLPFVPSDWTLHALGMSGVVASLLMQRLASRARPWRFLGVMVGLGVLMGLLGVWAHGHWIISKIQATPTWLFYCLGMFFPLFGCFYWLTDVRGHAGWFRLLRPAGTATLTCYVLSYLWYALQQLVGWHYPAVLCSGVPGLLRSLAFSLLLVGLTGLLVRAKIKLKV